MVLVTFIQFYEISAPAPYSDDQITVIFRMFLCVQKLFPVDCINLHLMAAKVNESFNKLCSLLDAFLIAEHGICQLNGKRAAVCHTHQIRLGEGLDNGDWSVQSGKKIGKVVAAK